MNSERAKNTILFAIGTAFVFFHLCTATFGVIPGIGQKAYHLLFVLVLFFLKDAFKEGQRTLWRAMDVIMILGAISSIWYIIKIDATLDLRAGIVYPSDIVFGFILIAVLLFAAWRCVGASLSIIVICFILYGFFGRVMPSFLRHAGMNAGRIVNLSVLTTEGIFGSALYASAVYIVLFVILGSLFNETGVGDYFTSVASMAFGRMTGGPAKVAVVASGFFGSINGSAIANVIGTGTFTIPMMKKHGFEPEFAGAVEASASTGGQIMPPIMGTTAFIAAEMIGISYFEFAKAAAIPAILYYVALIMSVDLYARKNHLVGISKEDVPEKKKLLRKLYLFSPLVFLVVCMAVFNFTITRSGLYTVAFTLVVTSFNKESRLTWDRFKKIIIGSVNGAIPVGIACAVVGVIIAVVNGSGLAFRMSSILVNISNGNIYILLFLTMIVSIILGMGVPTTAAYLVLAVLAAPAMIKLGVPPIAAHLFVFYFGIISNITPPVALAAYAAAGIAKCSPNKTGYRAFKLAISGFILPYMFVLNPVLLWNGSGSSVLTALISSLVGIYLLSCSMEKFAFKWNISQIERVFCGICAFLLIDSHMLTDVIGLAFTAALLLYHIVRDKRGVSMIS